MRKIFTKIISFSAAAVVASGLFLVSACNNYYNSGKLDYTSSVGDARSNGGFAVEKGDYIYFINGKESNTADNTFGKPVKGSIMRISRSNFDARNYSAVDTVVPHVIYSGSYNAGIFIYGDYVYYATPSTDKNSDGEVQNSYIAFKSTKLDGTETLKTPYVQYKDNTIEYRFVEVGGTVYLLYVAAGEDYFDNGSSYTNIHSVNTKTGEDTLLAYNVGAVTFDKSDLTNPRIFYTMKVTDFKYGTSSSYNQVYTVTADAKCEYATGAIDHTEYFEELYKDTEEGYDAEKDPKYVNCGELVLDGIGFDEIVKENITRFNHKDVDKVDQSKSSYTFSLTSYQNGTLLYTGTRATTGLNDTGSLYSINVDGELLTSSWNPVLSVNKRDYILSDASSAGSYTFLFGSDGKLSSAIIANSNGFIKAGLKDGKIVLIPDNDVTYYITKNSGQPTVLFTDSNYIYYSLTGGNGYTVYRVSYLGSAYDYEANKLPTTDTANEYKAIRILDLDCDSSWYKPEMFHGQLLFPTQTENMTSYPYIMACDLRNSSGIAMTNDEIVALNEQYEKISEDIESYDAGDYENLQDALRYAFYTGDGEYIHELIQAYVDIMKYDETHFWSEDSLKIYDDFVTAKEGSSWHYADDKEVNGVKVGANKRDYYYTVLGKMTEADEEAYAESLKTTYLKEYPESDKTWFESLSTGAKVGFIIGVVAGGLLVIGCAAVVTLVILRKRKEKLPEYTKKRVKVDTTDDKSVNVYETEEQPETENSDVQE